MKYDYEPQAGEHITTTITKAKIVASTKSCGYANFCFNGVDMVVHKDSRAEDIANIYSLKLRLTKYEG